MDTNMAAVPLFRDTNMVAMTPCESTLYCLVKLWPKVHRRLQFSKMIDRYTHYKHIISRH